MSVATINIGGDANDESYRYQMPKMNIKIEGSGNGIKTLVTNAADVAKALHIPPEYVTKYFGNELGAQSKYDTTREASVVNGEFDYKTMFDILQTFISEFILCPQCSLPELTMQVHNKDILIDCAACGYNGNLQSVHKLTTYILKNPPDKSGMYTAGGGTSSGKKLTKAQKKALKKAQKKAQREQAAGTKKPKGGGESEGMVFNDEGLEDLKNMQLAADGEVEWSTETGEEAAAQRAKEAGLPASLLKAMGQAPSRPSEYDVDAEFEVVVQGLASMIKEEVEDEDVYEAAVAALKKEELDGEEERAYVVMSALLQNTNAAELVKTLNEYEELLGKISESEKQQKVLVGATERFVAFRANKNYALAAVVFKVLYDNDHLDEEVIRAWHERPINHNRYLADAKVAGEIKTALDPMITWLDEAEEDESEEEDDEDEEEEESD